jgi:hypothetical protein
MSVGKIQILDGLVSTHCNFIDLFSATIFRLNIVLNIRVFSGCSRCSSAYNQRRNFQLGLTTDRGETNYYNRWPSPSLPPTLKKVSKSESKKGLHLVIKL